MLKEADFDEPQNGDEENENGSKTSSTAPKNARHSSVSTAEILKSIKDGSKAPSQDAVNKDLEALRLHTISGGADRPGTLSHAVYEKVRSEISERYSVKQLSRYLRFSKKRAPDDRKAGVGHHEIAMDLRLGDTTYANEAYAH